MDNNESDMGGLRRELAAISAELPRIQNQQRPLEDVFPIALQLRVLAQSVPPMWRCTKSTCGGFTVSRVNGNGNFRCIRCGLESTSGTTFGIE